MNSEDLVFEFYVKYVTCKNLKCKSYPLVITMTGCPEIQIPPRQTTICKLTYNRGKRIIFNQTNFQNIKTDFVLQAGHGDTDPVASVSFDFHEIYMANENSENPAVFNVEAGLSDPYGVKFGTLYLVFQILTYGEYEDISTMKVSPRHVTISTSRSSRVPSRVLSSLSSSASTPRVIVSKSLHETPVRSSQQITPVISKIPFTQQQSYSARNVTISNKSKKSTASAKGSSIHDRYMKKNEMWIGTHFSTRADPDNLFSSRLSSRSRDSKSHINA